MRVLVTGSEGRIGRHLAGVLDGKGYGLRGFDTRADTQAAGGPIDDRHVGDLRDLPAVRSAMRGVDAVVHLGAIPSDRDDGAAVMQTNVMGSWNVLQAAQENGVRRVVFFSSINAQGSVLTGHPPAVLPIDDDYPHHPATPYQLSKHLGEEICRSFSERHGMITLCLRPTWVTQPSDYTQAGFGTDGFLAAWQPDLWAYVDVRDVGNAVLRCLAARRHLARLFPAGGRRHVGAHSHRRTARAPLCRRALAHDRPPALFWGKPISQPGGLCAGKGAAWLAAAAQLA